VCIIEIDSTKLFKISEELQHLERHILCKLHQLTTIPGSDFEAIDESSLQIDPNSGQRENVENSDNRRQAAGKELIFQQLSSSPLRFDK
jgi:hypothetical protein